VYQSYKEQYSILYVSTSNVNWSS